MKNIRTLSSAFIAAICSFAFLLSASAYAASANITGLVFTSAPQSIAAGAISDVISLQTQNAGGAAEQIDGTNDLYLTSTSPTGQFSSNATNWQPATQITMSKNTANKNFYYKDPNAGADTITAKIVGRTTGLTFSANQTMTVTGNSDNSDTDENGSSSDDDNDATDTVQTATSTATTTVVTNTVYISSHASPTDLSNWQDAPAFQISAGRERISYVGVPIAFSARYNSSPNIAEMPQTFSWSLGDGTTASGKDISHTYKYAGDYTVVLNGTCDGNDAVAHDRAYPYPRYRAFRHFRR